MRRLEKLIFSEIRGPRTHGVINKDLVGKNADVILATIGVQGGAGRARWWLADVPEDHPLVWSEQLMPVLPVVRVCARERGPSSWPRRASTASATRPACTRATSTR